MISFHDRTVMIATPVKPSKIIPISFNIYKILEDNRNFGKCNNIINYTSYCEKYLMQM